MQSEIVALSYEEAAALARCHENSEDEGMPGDSAIVNSLMGRVHVAMTRVGGSAFVKLSTRSPKDAIYEESCPEVATNLEMELAKSQEFFTGPRSRQEAANTATIAWFCACAAAFKCTDVQRAERLLKTSTRVLFDLNAATCAWEDGACASRSFPLSVIVRAWQLMEPHQEFRGFVKGGKLCALSQYYHHCFFPEMVHQREGIARDIQSFFAEAEPLLRDSLEGADGYVVDFLYLDEKELKGKQSKVQIIELNPLCSTTSGCLFKWDNAADIHDMQDKSAFTFRVLEALPEQASFMQCPVRQTRECLEQWVSSRLSATLRVCS